MQTKDGARKAKATMIQKYGSLKAYKEVQRENGSKGGKVTQQRAHGKTGFALNRELAVKMGKLRKKK